MHLPNGHTVKKGSFIWIGMMTILSMFGLTLAICLTEIIRDIYKHI